MIEIKAECLGLIGDALAAVPYMRSLALKHNTRAYVSGGYSKSVRPLLEGYPFVFDVLSEPIKITYPLNISAMWSHCGSHGWKWNMAQGWFAHADLPVPALPVLFPMKSEPCGVEPGVVISPYSRSNLSDNNKLWDHHNWLAVVERLRKMGLVGPYYVVGASGIDNPAMYEREGVVPYFSQPLTKVLDLIRQSPIVLGLDNGIGHLCHFGGVKNQVMIYCECLPAKFAESPFAEHVRARMPKDVTPDMVVQAAHRVLTR